MVIQCYLGNAYFNFKPGTGSVKNDGRFHLDFRINLINMDLQSILILEGDYESCLNLIAL